MMSIEIRDKETDQKQVIDGLTLLQAIESMRIGAKVLSLVPEDNELTGLNEIVCGETKAIQLYFQSTEKELEGLEFFQSLKDGTYFYFNNHLIIKMDNGLHWGSGIVWTWDDRVINSDGTIDEKNSWQDESWLEHEAAMMFMTASHITLKTYTPQGAEK